VIEDQGDGHLDERHASVLGGPCELLDRFELALVLGQRHVEASRWRAGDVGVASAVQRPESQPPASGL
jgi:hypothetical protein